ncbi:lytic transglycosylase domain-containing protein [Gordonia sp. (in: high G+C Gram-positive bacteria)]|uniref:lytic transglycosylase domain-containing protein n=1 Tax=Gordonia sp. (in: high G+C Gram-positive bacteria) TaxID=84139 RepID=UPI0039E562C2
MLTAGVGTTALSALVLGAASSSSLVGEQKTAATTPEAASVTQVAGLAAIEESAAAAAFAPPKAGDPMINPQYRLALGIPNGPLGIPGVVLQAYKLAETRLASENAACKLPWYLLAGIGRIESGHAGNGNVDEYGNTRRQIHGPALDGTLAGNAVILDAQGNGARAMGPMQFIPSTWASWGSDANGDGKADPHNIFDATYSAGRYLCSGVSDIMAGNNKVAAVYRYNHSHAYVANVLAWAAAYSTGVMPTAGIPDMHATPVGDELKKRRGDRRRGDADDPLAGDEATDPATGDAADDLPKRVDRKPKARKPECFVVCLPPQLGGPQQAPAAPRAPRQRPGVAAPGADRPAPAPGRPAPARPSAR